MHVLLYMHRKYLKSHCMVYITQHIISHSLKYKWIIILKIFICLYYFFLHLLLYVLDLWIFQIFHFIHNCCDLLTPPHPLKKFFFLVFWLYTFHSPSSLKLILKLPPVHGSQVYFSDEWNKSSQLNKDLLTGYVSSLLKNIYTVKQSIISWVKIQTFPDLIQKFPFS